ESLGRRAVCVPTDIGDIDQCRRLVDRGAAELGRIDVLINNAYAEESWKDFDGFDLARWRRPFEVNVFATLQLTQATVPHLKAAGGGSVVMITTLSTRVMNPVLGGYSASKRSLETASRTLAAELGRDAIRVNCIAPGHIWGRSLEIYFAWLARQRDVTAADIYEEIAGLNPMHHIPTSEEISRTVLFFASDLSRVITGQTLDVNCGRYLH
ncbi:MAG TPA: SDR family oxidoreductase, partial [Acidimicrobiales bacterium]|nr:SDR family oxidoreductase [Acidimicrobiales bacterium]